MWLWTVSPSLCLSRTLHFVCRERSVACVCLSCKRPADFRSYPAHLGLANITGTMIALTVVGQPEKRRHWWRAP
jgi:hypothetical protein